MNVSKAKAVVMIQDAHGMLSWNDISVHDDDNACMDPERTTRMRNWFDVSRDAVPFVVFSMRGRLINQV